MIFRLIKISLIFALWSGGWACNSAETSETETSSADSKSEEDSEGTDEPAWVNSMYLTCDWNSIESRNQVGVACAVASTNTALTPAAAGIEDKHWKTIDGTGKTVTSEIRKEGDKNIFVVKAQSLIGLSPQVTLSDGKFSKVITSSFEDLLEGLKKGGKLDACFNAEIPIDDCFKAIGNTLPVGDRYTTASKIKPEESACANKDTLPAGVPCEISSDGISGDLDQAREWYVYGNNIIATDGSLKSSDFCDAKGIKPTAPRGGTSIKTRWYPFWKQGTKPCFVDFNPKGSTSAFHEKFVIYDRKDGVDNEPYCMFAAIADPSIFGGKLLRMHIFKNPKLFPDAANKSDFSVSALEGFAEHFACTD
jgi:hypothetical protein